MPYTATRHWRQTAAAAEPACRSPARLPYRNSWSLHFGLRLDRGWNNGNILVEACRWAGL